MQGSMNHTRQKFVSSMRTIHSQAKLTLDVIINVEELAAVIVATATSNS